MQDSPPVCVTPQEEIEACVSDWRTIGQPTNSKSAMRKEDVEGKGACGNVIEGLGDEPQAPPREGS